MRVSFSFFVPGKGRETGKEKRGNGEVKNTMGIDVNYWLSLTF